MAIWVENSSGDFVKTLLDYGSKRKTHLNNWEAATTKAGSAFNVTDAITGATQSNHGTRTCNWNGNDDQGNAATDGAYLLCMELTDKNSTGNYSTFEFSTGTDSLNLTPADVPSFSSIQLVWSPIQKSGIDGLQIDNGYIVYPSPSSGVVEIKGKDIQYIELSDLNGKTFYKGNSTILDISNFSKGIYLVKIKTTNNTVIKRMVKQ